MNTDKDIADELKVLVGRFDVGDLNRIAEIVRILKKQEKLSGNDFDALGKGEKYLEEMQKLLAQQNQRQNQ